MPVAQQQIWLFAGRAIGNPLAIKRSLQDSLLHCDPKTSARPALKLRGISNGYQTGRKKRYV
ncbi:MAG: hypothetical protein ACJARR_003463 [Pseudophaeobacter arcticus]|jgi:hypothetical protein